MLKCPGSSLENFKKVITCTHKVLSQVNEDFFYSPYSLYPIILQILGLSTPLMGAGDSIYSITSFIEKIDIEAFEEAFSIPLGEKRLIADEIYEMLAPVLLGEFEEFRELLIRTRYCKYVKKAKKAEVRFFKDVMMEKNKLLSRFIKKIKFKPGDFAQIVHYGQFEDLYRENKFLASLPKNVLEDWFEHSFPIVSEITIKNVPDTILGEKKDVVGYIIFVANSTAQLMSSSRLRRKKILQSACLAKKLGVKIIGMAGLIASFAQGGHWLSETVKGVGFTTGHAFTIGNIFNIFKACVCRVDLPVKKSVVAVVGAGGSIGSGCAELFFRERPKELLLVELSSFLGVHKMLETKKRIARNNTSSITLSTDLSDIKKADVIICATNSLKSIITQKVLKKGAIVIDDSFPKNISKDIIELRKDVLFLEGGVVRLPLTSDVYASRNMPDLMDAPITRAFSCREIYGCLAEVLILALEEHHTNYGLGYANANLAKEIIKKGQRFGLHTAPLQCFDRIVEDERFDRVRHIVQGRNSYEK